MFKKFEGAHWKRLLDNSIDLLRQTFTVEASRALGVSPERIRGVEFRLGSLHVTFHVTHDDDLSQEEINQLIENYPFSEMWRLYSQFNGAAVDLDGLSNTIKGLEEQLAQKDLELESTRKMGEQKTCEFTKEIARLRNNLEEVEDRERNLIKELAKEGEDRKTIEAQFAASKEENQKLEDDLKGTKNHFVEIAHRYKESILAILKENKKEREAKERELRDQIEMKSYVIQNLEAKIRHLRGAEVDQHSYLNGNNDGASSRPVPHIKELSLQLRQIERSEMEVRSELGRLSESLKIA
ncbi:unnamed protein product [Phytomonas sp. EM1]|nr:unnamed protein product [Phytomonas sp. EM1]|eukprot:CCW60661.1 unnamed protein product [Phytomonas sp. isolate EM1]